ncbi:MAG: His/Gly/Thr/Pro-type tRNA ligase C-terminal domain-containing protein, partial [Candidatus Saccharimonadales bacterium]
HCALLGSIERFLSVYIEHTAGRFPVWLAPEQLRIIQVADNPEIQNFMETLRNTARDHDIRFSVDDSNDSLGKKIRTAEMLKIPYTLVIGEKEVASGTLSPRIRSDLEVLKMERNHGVEQFFDSLANEIKARASKSSL